MNYDEIRLKASIETNIDNLVWKIENALEEMHNLYKVFTKELTGKSYDMFKSGIVDYEQVLSLKGLSFKVVQHGYGEAFFLTYKKPWFWWFCTKKQFYFAEGFTFHVEYDSSTRYNYTVGDYTYILGVLEAENRALRDKIKELRDDKRKGD